MQPPLFLGINDCANKPNGYSKKQQGGTLGTSPCILKSKLVLVECTVVKSCSLWQLSMVRR